MVIITILFLKSFTFFIQNFMKLVKLYTDITVNSSINKVTSGIEHLNHVGTLTHSIVSKQTPWQTPTQVLNKWYWFKECSELWKTKTYLDDTLDVSMPLRVIKGTKLWCSLPPLGVGAENRSSSLTLSANYTTHGSIPAKLQRRYQFMQAITTKHMWITRTATGYRVVGLAVDYLSWHNLAKSVPLLVKVNVTKFRKYLDFSMHEGSGFRPGSFFRVDVS